MSCTILITGFGPFPGAPFNPTESLVKRLAMRRRPALADVPRIAHVFRTSYVAVDDELPRLVARHRPDVLLMFGLAARTPHVRIETRARNAVSARVPDVGGKIFRRTNIVAGAGPALAGRAPFQKLLHAARTARVPAQMSRDAGAYLCNYVYWHGITAACGGTARGGTARGGTSARERPIPIVAFVHVPAVARAPGRRAKRAPTLNDLTRAAEAILLALVTEARAHHDGVLPQRDSRRRRPPRKKSIRKNRPAARPKTSARRRRAR